MAALAVGCTGHQARRADLSDAATETAATAPTTDGPPNTQALRSGSAPTTPYGVSSRTLTFRRSAERTLRTTIWYPTRPSGSAVARGRFPLVVLSHGLMGVPSDYSALATRWARAGFVVVAPAYPHTSRGIKRFDVADVLNQPADASYVLGRTLALGKAAGDPLRGHLDGDHIAAAGHSAGAITTVGLFANGRDARLDAGIVLAGNAMGMGDAYKGAPAAMLFVHGDQDPVTPYVLARATYDIVPPTWPKAFLTMPGARHTDPYLRPERAGFRAVAATTTDFLRWALYGDAAAKARLTKDAGEGNRLDARL